MRRILATSIAAFGVIGLTVVGPGGIGAPGGSAVAATSDACSQQLNPDRREVYQLTNGGDTLSYGRIVVTGTAANYHRYCVQFQTGGRTVTGSTGKATYQRADGVCGRQLGAAGSGPGQMRGFESTMTVADNTCEAVSLSIKDGGRWFSASAVRVRN